MTQPNDPPPLPEPTWVVNEGEWHGSSNGVLAHEDAAMTAYGLQCAEAAVERDLTAISEALALDPQENGGTVPIIEAIAKLKAQAARYHWLRDRHWVEPETTFRLGLTDGQGCLLYWQELDAAIDEQLARDAARAGTRKDQP